MFHLEMSVLVPTSKESLDQTSILVIINRRIDDFRSGNIRQLYSDVMRVSSWRVPKQQPAGNNNKKRRNLLPTLTTSKQRQRAYPKLQALPQ